jgi:hypothetical protein
MHAARSVDLLGGELDAHDAYSPSGPRKAGERRQMTDADRIGLGLDDRRHADAGSTPSRPCS